jgi:hypothetical protein
MDSDYAGIKGPLFDPGSWSPTPVQMSPLLRFISAAVLWPSASGARPRHHSGSEVASIKSSGPLRLRPGQSIGMRTAWPASSPVGDLASAVVALHSNPGQPVIDSKIFSCF